MEIEILMVDDDPDEILVTRFLLERRSSDIRIEAYLEPDEAIAELERRAEAGDPGPTLVTVDINMPRHDGIAVASDLRPICARIGSRVGVLTGSINPSDEAAAMAADAAFFSIKPFNADALSKIGERLALFEVERDGRRLAIKAPDAAKQRAPRSSLSA